jgi:hypothetical protein
MFLSDTHKFIKHGNQPLIELKVSLHLKRICSMTTIKAYSIQKKENIVVEK